MGMLWEDGNRIRIESGLKEEPCGEWNFGC